MEATNGHPPLPWFRNPATLITIAFNTLYAGLFVFGLLAKKQIWNFGLTMLIVSIGSTLTERRLRRMATVTAADRIGAYVILLVIALPIMIGVVTLLYRVMPQAFGPNACPLPAR